MDFPAITNVEGILWPPVPVKQAARRLGCLFQLEQSQWWSEKDLVRHQLDQLNVLLRYAKENVPYYREAFDSLPGNHWFNAETWQQVPILTRDKLQSAGSSLHSTGLPRAHGKVYNVRTSGSTGKPVECLQSDINNFFWNVLTLRDLHWQRLDLSRKLAVIRHLKGSGMDKPGGSVAGNWGRATSGVYQTGPCEMLDIHTTISEQFDWLVKINPTYLQTHPSVLQELALESQRREAALPSLERVFTISEALPDGLRELVRDTWNVPLTDQYSSIELGVLALQCPDHEHYHAQSEAVYIEVLDEQGKQCSPGETGRVVITSLHNFASPLIRYEIGDYAEVGEACSCGRGLPVIKRILGRYRNLMTLPNGQKFWPRFGIADMLEIAPIKQYRAIQHALDRIEYELVTARPLSDDEKSALHVLLVSRLPDGMNVTISEVDEIPRSKAGKYEEFVSKI